MLAPNQTPLRSGPIPKRKAVLGQVYNMYEDAKKGKDAARIRAFIEVRGWQQLDWSNLIIGPPTRAPDSPALLPPSSSLRSPPVFLPKSHPALSRTTSRTPLWWAPHRPRPARWSRMFGAHWAACNAVILLRDRQVSWGGVIGLNKRRVRCSVLGRPCAPRTQCRCAALRA